MDGAGGLFGWADAHGLPADERLQWQDRGHPCDSAAAGLGGDQPVPGRAHLWRLLQRDGSVPLLFQVDQLTHIKADRCWASDQDPLTFKLVKLVCHDATYSEAAVVA